MRNIIYQAIYTLAFPLSADFTYENARLFTISDLRDLKHYRRQDSETEKSDNGYLVVEILVQVKDFELLHRAAAHARPKLLVVLGLTSLFSDFAFAPYMSFMGCNRLGDSLDQGAQTRFVYGEEQNDRSNELEKVLNALNNASKGKKRLVYSLIDRWRKARHMQEESEDSMEFDDEVVIAYFHVLELLATEYYGDLKAQVKTEVEIYLSKIYSGLMLFEGEYLKTMIADKMGLSEQIVLDSMPISGKILFALDKLRITGKRLKFLIGNLVKDRNSVAHGRTVYQDKIIFPVPAFFPNAKISGYTLDTLKTLTGHAICRYMDCELFAEEWQLEDHDLIPTSDEIKDFVNGKKYSGLSNQDFASGAVDGINPGAISWGILDKKIKPEKALEIFSTYLADIQEDEAQISSIIPAVALMADHAKGDQLEQCEKVLLIAAKNSWHIFNDIRDLLSFLEYNGWNPKHLEKMINDKKLR